jgi:DnaJ like chaperone protein
MMGYLGKIIGGSAGFFLGGPLGAVVGAALGHAADSGGLARLKSQFAGTSTFAPARVAAMLGRRDQIFAVTVVVLSAKLAKCDGPVRREEIDTFKRLFRIPPESVRGIGRLFDQARDSADDFEEYADMLGQAFVDNRGTLEEVLLALFAIARADAPLNRAEVDFLRRVHRGLGLDQISWDRAWNGASSRAGGDEPDPYEILGLDRSADGDVLRARWKDLMRENHPDSLASRGVPAEFIARASERVARINAAWDRIKRERGL